MDKNVSNEALYLSAAMQYFCLEDMAPHLTRNRRRYAEAGRVCWSAEWTFYITERVRWLDLDLTSTSNEPFVLQVFRTDVKIAPPEKESLECLADALSKAGQPDYECSSHIHHFYPAFQATQPAKLDPIVFDLRFPSSLIRSSLFALLQIFLSYTLEDLRALRHAHADASSRPKSSARSTDMAFPPPLTNSWWSRAGLLAAKLAQPAQTSRAYSVRNNERSWLSASRGGPVRRDVVPAWHRWRSNLRILWWKVPTSIPNAYWDLDVDGSSILSLTLPNSVGVYTYFATVFLYRVIGQYVYEEGANKNHILSHTHI
ncbi:hypothetical protein H4582DRAFT_2200477 [Lactarius indigo]|nr:hypothetical protein H4582DRAFT_2200477 [Lactarius indigo]